MTCSHATLRSNHSETRLYRLVHDLEGLGCRTRVDRSRGNLTFEVPTSSLWWIPTGCATVFFSTYSDVALWSYHFERDPHEADAAPLNDPMIA